MSAHYSTTILIRSGVSQGLPYSGVVNPERIFPGLAAWRIWNFHIGIPYSIIDQKDESTLQGTIHRLFGTGEVITKKGIKFYGFLPDPDENQIVADPDSQHWLPLNAWVFINCCLEVTVKNESHQYQKEEQEHKKYNKYYEMLGILCKK